ncbi:acetyl-CoA synthetase [Elysia marginata]|uniref:Medium-chain acyl-CoA ligase ACSF2, mitochondrial n=1 Tax=Elysia marginata TaxID=1093978 RepID=A0AAV4FLC2_9GAST|nr:acetyl-CoA synthetase [Elysia marginata]
MFSSISRSRTCGHNASFLCGNFSSRVLNWSWVKLRSKSKHKHLHTTAKVKENQFLCSSYLLNKQAHGSPTHTTRSFHSYSQCNPRQKWSYIHGPSSIPLLGVTIGQALQEKVGKHPDKSAAIFAKENVQLSFQELLQQADMLAAGFRRLGINRGDRVGIWGPNSSQWVLTQYATARAGIIMVNINPSYRLNELKYALKKSGCKAIVSAPGFKDVDYFEMLRCIIPELENHKAGAPFHSLELPDLKHVIAYNDTQAGALALGDLMSAATPSEIKEIFDLQDKLQFDDPINIQFTSGTTGNPKGACLSHHNIVNNSYFVGLRVGYHEHDAVICCPVPLYHCFGMVLASLTNVTHGTTTVWPSPAFNPEETLHAVETYKCTSLYGVPTMFIDMLCSHEFDTVDLSSLRTGIMAGSPCPIETMKEVRDKMNLQKITVCYGSTETSPVSFQSTKDCSLERRVSTVGKVLDHVEAKIIDHEGCVVPVGEKGELCTRGINNMLEYWDDPEKTKSVMGCDQWYHTGDLAVMTEDGYCSIVGREKDMLIRGGENIYPLEIEQILYEHPKIKDIQVIGVPDQRLGEQVCAWIEVKEDESLTEEEVKDFCKDKMAKYKIPNYILFVDDFPKTVTGKIQKFVMREQSTKMLGLDL